MQVGLNVAAPQYEDHGEGTGNRRGRGRGRGRGKSAGDDNRQVAMKRPAARGKAKSRPANPQDERPTATAKTKAAPKPKAKPRQAPKSKGTKGKAQQAGIEVYNGFQHASVDVYWSRPAVGLKLRATGQGVLASSYEALICFFCL